MFRLIRHATPGAAFAFVTPLSRASLLIAALLAIGPTRSGEAASTRPAHPFHATQAEVEWNPESQRFEVALSLWPVDVEGVLRDDPELRKQVPETIDLDDPKQHEPLDEALRRYVESRFALVILPPADSGADDAGETTEVPAAELGPRRAAVEWLGFEIEQDSLWCYFELVPHGNELPAVPAAGRGIGPNRRREEPAAEEREATEGTNEADPPSHRLRFRNSLFFELHPDQENVILLRVGDQRRTLRATNDRSPEPYRWPARND